jgi:hypothetical protein
MSLRLEAEEGIALVVQLVVFADPRKVGRIIENKLETLQCIYF